MPYVNLTIAAALAGVCAWTDASKTKDGEYKLLVPNWVVFPGFIAGVVLCLLDKRYNLLFAALLVFVLFSYFRIRYNVGGGDLKLAVTLALLLGLEPVLYGTILASMLMLVYGMVKVKRMGGSFSDAAGLLQGISPEWFDSRFPFAALMGPSIVVIAAVQQYLAI